MSAAAAGAGRRFKKNTRPEQLSFLGSLQETEFKAR